MSYRFDPTAAGAKMNCKLLTLLYLMCSLVLREAKFVAYQALTQVHLHFQ